MQKVNLLTRKIPLRAPAKTFVSKGFDEEIELLLRPLTDLEEIEAGELAVESHSVHGGKMLVQDEGGNQLFDVPKGAFNLASRFYTMQEVKLYSVEEFILMFIKYEGIANQLIEFAGEMQQSSKKKAASELTSTDGSLNVESS